MHQYLGLRSSAENTHHRTMLAPALHKNATLLQEIDWMPISVRNMSQNNCYQSCCNTTTMLVYAHKGNKAQ